MELSNKTIEEIYGCAINAVISESGDMSSYDAFLYLKDAVSSGFEPENLTLQEDFELWPVENIYEFVCSLADDYQVLITRALSHYLH